MRIYLIGYMYSGKTTLGRQLASRLGMDFVDLDELVERHYRTTVPILFSRYGESTFRVLEQHELHATERLHNCVVSTGGGTPCYADNMQWINAHGLSVFLQVGLPVLLERMANSRNPRPILAGLTPEQRQSRVQSQLAERLPYYTQASITFCEETSSIESLAAQICDSAKW